MFTSEPLLTQRIERMIGDIPIVDSRSNLAIDRLGAPDLASLIAEAPVRLALVGVGMPDDATDPSLPPDERVVLALPFLRQIRNTSAAWCLFRIFRDLYDFDEPHLTVDNYEGLMDRVARSARDPDWARQVLRSRARIKTSVTPLPSTIEGSEIAQIEGDDFFHRLEIVGRPEPGAAADPIRSALFDELDQQIEGRVRFVALSEIPDLSNPVHTALLEWHHLHHWPIQVVLDQPLITQRSLGAIDLAVARYPQARFALMVPSDELAAEVASLAQRAPNVFVEGFCGWGVWPSSIERNLITRIERVGITKISGFASGASSAEWVYGSLQATKKATASAFAQAISGGFFEEDEIPPILLAMFQSSPTDWYQLRKS